MSCPATRQNNRHTAMPSWITAAMIAETIAVWSPYYGHELTTAEAIEILMSVGRLIDTLQDSSP